MIYVILYCPTKTILSNSLTIRSCYSSIYMYIVIIESKREGRLEFIFDKNVYINQVNYTTLCAKVHFSIIPNEVIMAFLCV